MKTLVVAMVIFLAGCVDTLQDAARPPGQMNPDGTINPCHGYEGDKALCGESLFFAKAITQIELGQTRDEVREVMKRDPWRRKLKAGQELWGYSTSYSDERMSWILFTDGKVTEVRESEWDEEE